MTMRRTNRFVSMDRKVREKKLLARQRELLRDMKLELLEDRRVMAGPQLAGILPDDGHLLAKNEVLEVAPQDLTFRFDENTVIDSNTVAGISVWRSGFDGKFSPAVATTDFNTGGAVQVTFSAKALGTTENGISVAISSRDFGGVGLPLVTASGRNVSVVLNSNAANPSTAADLVLAVNASAAAGQLLTAAVTGGQATRNITATANNYSPLTLIGANAAFAESDFGTQNAAKIRFTAASAGDTGNGVQVVVTKSTAVTAPAVSVSGKTVFVQTANGATRTRAIDLVNAINNNAAAKALLTASIIGGNPQADIVSNASASLTLTLGGANDVQIVAGYQGIGASSREVIARFAETLPDDRYHIDIFGNGALALKNNKGEAFNNGVNYQHEFELDLGAQVIAVVPQPVDRLANGSLFQRTDEIDVYFNNDDLLPSSVTNPSFYQLIYTNNTVTNADDGLRFNPVSVTYDATTDKATLKFSKDIAQLRGAGTYRLRLGTNEGLGLSAPLAVATKATAATDFNTSGAVSVKFDAVAAGEVGESVRVVFSKANLGPGVVPSINVYGTVINVVLNSSVGSSTTAQQLVDALRQNVAANALVTASITNGVGATDIATSSVNYSPIRLALPQNRTFGSSFDTAYDVSLDTASKVLDSTIIYTSAIDPEVFTLAFPGDGQEPGHRDTPVESHIQGDASDTTAGITTVQYNFRSDYGWDPLGNPLSNVITDNQKQRAREAFQIISEVAGIQFVETPDQGITVATGDTRALFGHCGDVVSPGFPFSGSGVPHSPSCIFPVDRQLVVLDNAETWDDSYGGSWFQRAMHEIFISLGLGTSYDLPPGNLQGNDGPTVTSPPTNDNINSSTVNVSGLQFDNTIEPSFPGAGDIVHLQHLYRPESKDIDLYKFVVDKVGLFSAETVAERRLNSSQLDTALRLYKEVSVLDSFGNVIGKKKELFAQNDDYFSNDSFIELDLTPGTYWIGVSASGNTSYDPVIEDTGIGGTSQGEYDLRLNFRPRITNAIVDTTGKQLDGDSDGTQGGVYNFWFQAGSTIFVDKTNDVRPDPDAAGPSSNPADGNGSLSNPFDLVSSAIAVAQPGQIIRVVGNGGADGNIATLSDNLAYEIGFSSLGLPLQDGATMQVPKQVTLMVDAGAVFKMRRSEVAVGSTSPSIDQSGGALQILGTPKNSVYFTSYEDSAVGKDLNPDTVLPKPGDWGGLAFRRDVDRLDLSRFDFEKQGVFLNYVNHADIRFGGGVILVGGASLVVNPIHMTDARPTITYNTITRSADAAMSASPNSFEETNFNSPQYQSVPFSLDYSRIGPEIHGNLLRDQSGNTNSVNGLAVRVNTLAGQSIQSMTVTGRWDDTDIVHVVTENVIIAGTPGGPISDSNPPSLSTAIVTRQIGGGTFSAGTYDYRITFVDASGNESVATTSSPSVTVANGDSVRISNLLTSPAGFIGRRIYRSGNGPSGSYTLVAETNGSSTTFTDTGVVIGGLLNPNTGLRRARLDAGLTIDPAIVVKLDGGSLSTTMGGRLFAEGLEGLETVFTSLADDRYGAGGTFLTRNDGVSNSVINSKDANAPAKGDWAGLILGPYSNGSIDHAVVAFGGGIARVEGSFTGMNVLEINQAEARIANTLFENNENGLGGQAPTGRFGRGFNEAATIFVRGAQPIIVGNTIVNGNGPALSINVNALDSELQVDSGRSTGLVDALAKYQDNQGPLVRENRMDGNLFNAMVVRGETVTTESVWDDTDIVHLLQDTVYIYDFHTFGGVRLESSPTQSLVVKSVNLDPRSSNPLIPDTAGFVADGRPLEIDDRIGGILQVLGQPGFPVVLTSVFDNSVGAGLKPDGSPLTETTALTQITNTLLPTIGEANNGLLIDNDVATAVIGHFEARVANGGDITSSGVTVQGKSAVFTNQDYIFDFHNYIDTGSDGKGVNLAATTITQPATLVGNDLVASSGTFQGPNGIVSWRVETRLDNGVATVFNKLILSSSAPLGNIRFISYLDEDVQGISDDILYKTGTPGAADFRAFTLDGPERIGFSHGGVYLPGADLVNASYTGWAADEYSDLLNIIQGAGTNYSIPGNIDTVDLPPFVDPELGAVNGPEDITTAFAWNVDPNATTATMTSFLELIASNPSTGAAGGDWRGIRIEGFAHDRNVATVLENEPLTVAAPGRNGTPAQSQYLGQLAPNEKSGDENQRLGFTVHGTISATNDIDVYSFSARAGTEIWVDIDRTTQTLDTVVELVDSNGTILAQSDNSVDEQLGSLPIYVNPAYSVQAGSMQKTAPFGGNDRWTVNPRDAGMRLVLPGQPNSTRPNPYHLRVRSSNLTSADPRANLQRTDLVSKGLTTGSYQLQIRLQETDEIGGTAVQTSDIRFAENGITVLGQPSHSPLAGETSEVVVNAATNFDSNDTFATAQSIGNLLTSDRGAVGVSGFYNGDTDIDWYRLDVDFTELETAVISTIAAAFDIDYADGLARPDLQLWVFDGSGRLILSSDDSNIADDRPAPVSGSSTSDLARGSVGALDSYIGTANLRTGANLSTATGSSGPYYIAVSSPARTPLILDQFGTKLAANPLVRMEPINSIVRIAEDHIEDPLLVDRFDIPSTAATPIVPKLLTDSSAVPYFLGDVPLFLSYDNGIGVDRSTLITVNPFTGQLETIVNNNFGTYGRDVGDIAMRADGRLYAFALDEEDANGPQDASSGVLLNIDTGTGVATVIRDDGITTYEESPTVPGAPIVANNGAGYGVQFYATSFIPNGVLNVPGEQLLSVGNRGDLALNNGVSLKRNVLYWFTNDQNSGTLLGSAQPNTGAARLAGAGTNAIEVGRIFTGAQIIAPEATVPNKNGLADLPNSISDALSFDINDGLSTYTFEFDAGPEVLENINTKNPNQVIRDGNFFLLDPDSDPLSINDETIFQFDTGVVMDVIAGSVNIPRTTGETFTVNGPQVVSPTAPNKVSVTFEFVNSADPVTKGKPINPNNVPVDLAANLTSTGVAGAIAAAINGAVRLGVTATPVANRVSLQNDLTVSISNGLYGSIILQGDTGSTPILSAVPGSTPGLDGSQFSFTFPGPGTFTFEFTTVGGLQPGDDISPAGDGRLRAIPFNVGMDVNQIASQMNAAFVRATTFGANVPPITTQLVQSAGQYGRVVVNGQLMTYAQGSSPIVDMTSLLTTIQIPVEEFFDNVAIGQAVGGTIDFSSGVVNTNSTFTASADLNRINFPAIAGRTAAEAADFRGVPVWTPTASTYGVAPGNFTIPFRAEDLPAPRAITANNVTTIIPGISNRIANAINSAQIAGVTAVVNGNEVTLDNPSGLVTVPNVTFPVVAAGQGPGGDITGMASVNGSVYAVSDRGGLYRLNVTLGAANKLSVATTYMQSSSFDLQGIQFSGLAAGPANAENQRYDGTLFATDRGGRLYAFDTNGILQPLFVDGQTSVLIHVDPNDPAGSTLGDLGDFDLANGGVQGMAFSTLDFNLWHRTSLVPYLTPATPMDVRVGAAATVGQLITVDEQQFALGHGRYGTYDQSRPGLMQPSAASCPPIGNAFQECGLQSYHFGLGNVNGTPRTYDFPGGAKGSLVSEEFDLSGYSAEDQPTLYFSYFAETEDANTTNTFNYDSLRVFATDDSGVWTRIAYNDDGVGGVNVFDNSNSWRQARVSLAGFAGRDNVRLRFDFSTAGDMNVGDSQTTGEELRAIAGNQLNDGDTFRIDNQTFEFDSGYTITLPSGMAIQDGETFRVDDGVSQVTFEFDNNGVLVNSGNVRIFLDQNQTGADLGQIIRSAIVLNGPANVNPRLLDNQINLSGAVSVTQGLAPGQTRLAVVLSGVPGVTPGNVQVVSHVAMTKEEVAASIDAAMEFAFPNQSLVVSDGSQFSDGDSFALSNGTTTSNFEMETGYVVTLASGQQIADGDTIKLFDSAGRWLTLEFDKDGAVAAGNTPIAITDAMTVATIVRIVQTTIQSSASAALMGMIPSVISGSRLQVQANADVELKLATVAPMSVAGKPGVNQSVQFVVPGALGIQVPVAGGVVIRDGEFFTIGDGVNNVTFEFDSNGAITPGRKSISFVSGDSASTIAGTIATAVGTAGLGLLPQSLGNGLVDLGTTSVHTLDVTQSTVLQRGRAGAVVDGEQFTIGDGTSTVSFEMDSNGFVPTGKTKISFTAGADPDNIAQSIVSAISSSGLAGLNPVRQSLGTVMLGETAKHSVNSNALVNIQRTGIPGDNVTPIQFAPGTNFSAAQMATAIMNAINSQPLGVAASISTGAQRRVELQGNPLSLTVGVGNPPVFFATPTDVVKRDRDMIRVIGHTVTDQGPLGLQGEPLRGDLIGDPQFLGGRVGYNDTRRGQANQFEGFYLDDVIIGFAERGEMVTGAGANTNFTPPPALPTGQFGPYQLEIRRSEEYGLAAVSFDTNERLAEGITLIASAGAYYHDGQALTLSNGARDIVFEFNDRSILPGLPGYGVAQGNVAVDFSPTDTDWAIAARIRDLINGPVVQNAFSNVVAALSDGTDGKAHPGPSTSNRVNIFGEITLGELSATVSELAGTNDTIATATDSGIQGINSSTYVATGVIGDNPNFPLETGHDVDLYRAFLNAGETLRIDVDGDEIGSSLDPVLAVFTAGGTAINFNDNAANTGEFASLDPYIAFTAPTAGVYYIGVSGRSQIPVAAPFALYNPTIEGSAPNGSTGFYRLTLTFGDPSRAEFSASTATGDQNRERDQGQLILSGNTISYSARYGILIDADTRDATTNAPHQGPARTLPVMNTQNQVPGVVVVNNLIAGNTLGGIRFSGQTNAANQPQAMLPFGRIVNNTIVGIGGNLLPGAAGRRDVGIQVDENASPTLLNNVIANTNLGVSIDASSQTSVVGGSLYQGNGTLSSGVSSETSPIVLAVTDPLFVDAAKGNFYLAKGSVAIDSSIDSLEDRSNMVTVRSPLGIAPSPLLSPDRDLLGLLRVDDPNVAFAGSGVGNNIFKDRGALDRADFSGSTAVMLDPRDEVFAGAPTPSSSPRDQNGAEGMVQFPSSTVTGFSIQLIDGVEPADPTAGVGVDDSTVSVDKLLLLKNNELQQPGIDYSFSLDTLNNVLRLTPLAGVWETNKTYTLELVNKDQFVFTVPNGNVITEGQTFAVSDSTRTAIFEFDAGYILQVPASVGDSVRFSIQNGSATPVTFEFDSNNNVTAGNVRIPFSAGATQNDLANAVAVAISSQGSLGMAARNISNGKVYLGGTTQHVLNLTNSPLSVTGRPGVTTAGAIAVPFIPGALPSNTTLPAMTDNQVAESIVSAIENANLVNVRATSRAYMVNGVERVEVVLRGAQTFTGFTNVFTRAIRDLAGNELKANNVYGSTLFTILLGNGLDFGDAPTTYPVSGTNAASHGIVPGFWLGSAADPEGTGIVSANANGDDLGGNGDDEDGVSFDLGTGPQTGTPRIFRGGSTKLTVTASASGYLDAFVDFNRDGDWDDAGEQVFKARPVVGGANPLSFELPVGVALGTSFARFRFSSTGNLGPSGTAADGEVEDYMVTIETAPWQNQLNPLDVSGDTYVSAIDALLMINFINTYAAGAGIPLPYSAVFNYPQGGSLQPDSPGAGQSANYFDVDGDGVLTPSDIILVINYLNAKSGAGAESGEGEMSSSLVVTAADAPSDTPTNDAVYAAIDIGNSVSFLPNSSVSTEIGKSTVDVGVKPAEFVFRIPQTTDPRASNSPLALAMNASDDPRVLALDEVLEDLADTSVLDCTQQAAHDALFAAFDL